jgi:hypothetical protein
MQKHSEEKRKETNVQANKLIVNKAIRPLSSNMNQSNATKSSVGGQTRQTNFK